MEEIIGFAKKESEEVSSDGEMEDYEDLGFEKQWRKIPPLVWEAFQE